MSPEPTFWGSLASKLAVRLTADLLGAVAGAVRRKLLDTATQQALTAAVREAIETSLRALPTPASLADFGAEGRQHFEDLLTDFLASEKVVDQVALLIHPRPVLPDFEAVVAAFDEEHERRHFPNFDLEAFLRAFARELYAAAAQRPALHGVIELRLLGEILGVSTRIAIATERSALASEHMSGEIAELNAHLRQLLAGGSETPLIQNVQVVLALGWIQAFQGYEVVMETLRREGYDVGVDPASDALEIAGGSEQKALPPAGRTALLDLRRAVLEHQPTPADLDDLDRRYRRSLIRWFGNLEFQGLMRAPRPIVLPLEDVYVELRAVAEVPEAADAFSVDERRLLLEVEEGGAFAPEKHRDLMSQLDALRRERWSRTLPERKSIAEALHRPDQRACVVLGDPGSGKTTLLHYLALVYARGAETASERLGISPAEAERLPIFVPLAAFDDMRAKRGSLTLREFLPLYYDARRGLPGLGPLFDRALGSGRALLLFDGLDEVIDVQTRRYVAEQVNALMGEWTPRGVRFALASRVVGYREAPVAGAKVSTLTVLDFGEREIETFVRRWSRAFEAWAGGGPSPEATLQAQTLEKDLMDDVRSNASVRRLAANPLMLTMLALLRRQVGRLPHRRIQLYEGYVGTLLENWVYSRSLDAREESLELLDRHRAENVLIPLAFWLQQEKPSGTAGRAEIHRKLTDVCLHEEGLTRDGADRPTGARGRGEGHALPARDARDERAHRRARARRLRFPPPHLSGIFRRPGARPDGRRGALGGCAEPSARSALARAHHALCRPARRGGESPAPGDAFRPLDSRAR